MVQSKVKNNIQKQNKSIPGATGGEEMDIGLETST